MPNFRESMNLEESLNSFAAQFIETCLLTKRFKESFKLVQFLAAVQVYASA